MQTDIFLYAVLTMGFLGAVFAAGLTIAARVFAVDTDPRVDDIEEVLPGANCGACGEPGCQSFAEGVVAGKVPVNGCPVGGADVAAQIARIMGQTEAATREREIAHVLCRGNRENAVARSVYDGIPSCAGSQALGGGHKSCPYGCLGLGDCVDICPFGAAVMGEDGLPQFDPDKCTGCGKCVEACPRNIVTLAGISKKHHIYCSAKLSAKEVRKVCSVGCIGCQRCVKACPEEAISMDGKLAVMDYEKCKNSGECVEVCPMNTVQRMEQKELVKK